MRQIFFAGLSTNQQQVLSFQSQQMCKYSLKNDLIILQLSNNLMLQICKLIDLLSLCCATIFFFKSPLNIWINYGRYCKCKQQYNPDNFMIQCDGCLNWWVYGPKSMVTVLFCWWRKQAGTVYHTVLG
jgi:hypothetical protein